MDTVHKLYLAHVPVHLDTGPLCWCTCVVQPETEYLGHWAPLHWATVLVFWATVPVHNCPVPKILSLRLHHTSPAHCKFHNV